jgi:hypothetical protein
MAQTVFVDNPRTMLAGEKISVMVDYEERPAAGFLQKMLAKILKK